LERCNLRSVIETGARFLLDPLRKHQPTLISPNPDERARRIEFLQRAIDIAREVGSDAVSFWSGSATDDAPAEVLMERLSAGVAELCCYAAQHQVRLAFEPEPGMFIDTMSRFAAFHERAAHDWLGLTIDIGHLHCLDELPIADQLRRWRDRLWNVHIEDMRRGVHDHLMFGEGEIEFGPVIRALNEIGYGGGVHVELSRHSHDAVDTARRALAILKSQ
jgi:sugar phosphate isomerase/epimerase